MMQSNKLQNKINTKELVLFALFGVLIFGLKFVMAGLPNIEPVTLLLILSSVVFGKKSKYILCSYVLLEVLVYGLGIWTVGYLYIWLLLIIVCNCLLRPNSSALLAAAIGGIFGLLFGACYIPIYCITGNVDTAILWWVAGIPYDIVHGIANFILIITLYSPLKKALSVCLKHFN